MENSEKQISKLITSSSSKQKHKKQEAGSAFQASSSTDKSTKSSRSPKSQRKSRSADMEVESQDKESFDDVDIDDLIDKCLKQG